MKLSLVITLFCLVFYSHLSAQLDVEINLIGAGDLTPYKHGGKGFDLRYEGVRGTPLLFEDWQTAQIQLVNQDTFSNPVKINVDLEQNIMIIQMRNGTLGQVNISKMKAFKIIQADNQSDTWQILPEKEVENNNNGQLKCYQILYHGTFTFLKEVNKKFVKASYQQAYSIGNRYDEYVPDVVYWLRENKAAFQKVKLKQKAIEAALPSQASRLGRVAKTQNLNIGNEKEVAQLLAVLENGD